MPSTSSPSATARATCSAFRGSPGAAIARERDLPERTAARYARGFLETDAADLVRIWNDRRDAAHAPWTGDVSAERVDDIVHALFDIEHGERPRSQEQLDAHFEPVVLAIADTPRRL